MKNIFLLTLVFMLAGLSSCSNMNIMNGQDSNVRFGVFTDAHYADVDNRGTRNYRDSLAKISEFVVCMNNSNVDFIIELGDLKDMSDSKDPQEAIKYLQRAEKQMAEFNGPRYHVLGNHDMDCITKTQFLSNIVNSGIDANKTYYSFDVKGVHFVVLDANFNSDSSDYANGNFDWTDANITEKQLSWLENDLGADQSKTIVFVHQLLDGSGAVYVNNAAQVRNILEKSGRVIAVFQGHHHAGDYSKINGIEYFTVKGMVEGPGLDNNAFGIVEINGKEIELENTNTIIRLGK
ncbi:MAG: metallophosphoesterase [Phycisphaerae bacterium]|nr:metallophosphoesterase [Phycisphaerae bacterium]